MALWRGAVEDMAVKGRRFWKGRNVLVSGGAGFIGYALATQLAKLGAKVVVLDIKPSLPDFTLGKFDGRTVRGKASNGAGKKIKFVRGSVTSKQTVEAVLRKHKIKTVFHLAAEAIVARANRDPARALYNNAQGTWTLLEAIRQYGNVSETVVASSDKAYGSHEHLPYTEKAALRGLNPYDCSKSCTDLIAQMYAHAFALPIAILRCGNVYGPGDTNWSRLIPDAFRCVAKGNILDIRSDGTFKRDYVYIDDIVDAYLLIAEKVISKKLRGEAFNIGNNRPLRVVDVLKEMSRVVPALQYKILNTAKNEIKHQYLDSSKARRKLLWRARTSFREGLQNTSAWYAAYLARRRRV